MILADDNFATIVQAVREGRAILGNIRKFLRYLLSSNMGEVLTVFLGMVGSGVIGLNAIDAVNAGSAAGTVALALLATQLPWIKLITDSAPALAIGVDPPADDLMARKPRHVTDRLIDARMWASVIQPGVVIAAVSLLTMDFYLPGGLIAGTNDLTTARTAGFTVLVFTSLLTCFTARSDTTSVFASLFVNPWLWSAIALSLVLQVAVVHVPFLNTAFGTAPLAFDQWLVCAAMASVVLIYSEGQKLIRRRWGRRSMHFNIAADVAKLSLFIVCAYALMGFYARRRRPQWTEHLTKRRLAVLAMLTLAVGGIKLIEDVVAKESGPVDEAILWFIRNHAPEVLNGFFAVVTTSGSARFLMPVAIIAAVALLVARQHFEALLVGASVITATLVV